MENEIKTVMSNCLSEKDREHCAFHLRDRYSVAPEMLGSAFAHMLDLGWDTVKIGVHLFVIDGLRGDTRVSEEYNRKVKVLNNGK